jgi:hypothetical protein
MAARTKAPLGFRLLLSFTAGALPHQAAAPNMLPQCHHVGLGAAHMVAAHRLGQEGAVLTQEPQSGQGGGGCK